MEYSEIKELIEIFEKTDLNDMEVVLGDARVRLNRGKVSPWQMPTCSQPVMPQMVEMPNHVNPSSASEKVVSKEVVVEDTKEQTTETGEQGGKVIKAPIVGTFYQSSAPDKDPFVKVGDTVSEGDVVCIIEAMKFMNEVNSNVSGTITEVLVKDGEFVEFGQELFRVK